MSRLHLLILWILAIAAGFLSLKNKENPSSTTSDTKLEIGAAVLPSNLVDTIDELKVEKDGKIVTLKKTDSQWLVVEQNNFPANLQTLTQVFDTLREIKVAQGIGTTEQYYDRFNLNPSSEDRDKQPDSITLITEGKESAKLYLGKSREATGGSSKTAGRFIRLASDESGIYIVQQNFAGVDSDSANWIDKDFSPLREGTLKISVSAPQDDLFKAWTISRKSVVDDFLLEGLDDKKEETKTNETGTLKNLFSRSSFLELLSAEEAKERANQKGTREIEATDSSGATFLITIVPEKKEEQKEEAAPDQTAPSPPENFIASIKIINGPTKPEPPAADADTQAKAVYEQRIANLADLSANVNRLREKFQDRFFLLSKAPLASVLKNRGEFLQAKKIPKKKASVATRPIPAPTSTTSPAIPLQGNSSPPPSIARPTETQTKEKKVEAQPSGETPPPLPDSTSE